MTQTATDSIIEILARYLRCLTLGQIARTSFSDAAEPLAAAWRWLGRKQRAGLVALHTAPLHPELALEAPLLDFRPGDPLPSFDALAWQASSRWTKPARMTILATATNEARTLTGGSMGLRPQRLTEISHDVHLASVYLRLCALSPELATHWIHEDVHCRGSPDEWGIKVPDAIIAGPEPMIIEFIGRYSSRKLRSLAAHYAAWGRFQVW